MFCTCYFLFTKSFNVHTFLLVLSHQQSASRLWKLQKICVMTYKNILIFPPGNFSLIITKNDLLNRWFVHCRFPDKYISHEHSQTSVTHWRDARKLSAAALSAHRSFLALWRFFPHQFSHMQKLSNCILFFLFKNINKHLKRNWKKS